MSTNEELEKRVATLERQLSERDENIAELEAKFAGLEAAGGAPKTAWPAKRIRETFIGFFEKKHAHTFVPAT